MRPMDRGALIKDLTIIAVMLVASTLVYLVFRNSIAEHQSTETEPPKQGTQATSVPSEASTTPETAGSIRITVLREGMGREAKNGDTITVDYIGTLENGTIFDSSYDRKQPLTLVLGRNDVILGWEIGLLGMRVGEKRSLVIPPELAYGEHGLPPIIPPNATLHFEVELRAIE